MSPAKKNTMMSFNHEEPNVWDGKERRSPERIEMFEKITKAQYSKSKNLPATETLNDSKD